MIFISKTILASACKIKLKMGLFLNLKQYLFYFEKNMQL